jgi:hypothetical protein
MMRRVLLYTDEEENWIAEVPSLPGCGSEGKAATRLSPTCVKPSRFTLRLWNRTVCPYLLNIATNF